MSVPHGITELRMRTIDPDRLAGVTRVVFDDGNATASARCMHFRMFGEALRVVRTWRVGVHENAITLHDRVTNDGSRREPHRLAIGRRNASPSGVSRLRCLCGRCFHGHDFRLFDRRRLRKQFLGVREQGFRDFAG